MESYRTVRALAAIKTYMEEGKNQEAYDLVQKLNPKKVRSVQDLNMMAQICAAVECYEDAKEINLLIYERTTSRRALAQVVEFSIKQGQIKDAEYFLEKYEKAAPMDPSRLIYRFRIYKMQQASLKEQIAVLEQWKTEEYAERWAYELAKLYHKAGDSDHCVKECNDIILWFGEGKYVEWASVLRGYHTGEVDIETLQQYQKQNAEPVAQEEPQEEFAPTEIQEDVLEARLYEDEREGSYEAEPEQGTFYEEAEEAETAENMLTEETTEQEFDDEAVTNALISAVEEMSKEEPERIVVSDYVAEETKEVFEEEAIRYMQDYLGDFSTKHVVDLKGKADSKYQPEEGGALEAMLYERELCLEELLGNFVRIESVRKQIVRALDLIFAPNKRGNNLIITGGALTGKTELAKKIVKMLYRFQILSATRVAIVDADKLNKMNFEEKQDSLMECCLIVERAGELTNETVEKLLNLSAASAGKTLLFLEGDRKSINELLRHNAELNRVFNNRIHLPEEYRPAELKGFVFDYLLEKEYEIDVYADEVLEERIRMMLGAKSENPIRDSIAIGKAGIKQAEKRAAKNLTKMAATGNYENADIMVLHKEDLI